MDQDPSQEIRQENTPADEGTVERSSRKKTLGIPSWTLVLLTLVLAGVLVWAGNALIRSRQRFPETRTESAVTASLSESPTPGDATPAPSVAASTRAPAPTEIVLPPTPVPPAQTVILVAEFEQPEEDSAQVVEAAQTLYQTLLARARSAGAADWAHIEQTSRIVTRESVVSAAEAHNAECVLWGSGGEQRLNVYLSRIGRPPAGPLSSQARQLSLSVPDETLLCGAADMDAAASFVLGIAAYGRLRGRGEMEPARSWFRETLDAAEGHAAECESLLAHTYLYIGNVAALGGEYDAALTYYETGLGLTSAAADQALLYTNQASIYYAQEETDAALAAATLAVERAPDLANAYYHRANARRAQQEIEDAQSDLDRALALDPRHARAYASRGLLHHSINAFEEALQDYARALELDPWAAEVYLNRGGTYATLGDLDAAVQDYSLTLALQPDDADAFYNRGTVYAIQQRYSEALDDFSQALALRPDFSQVYGNRGLAYKALGERDAAIADFEAFLELSDNAQWRAMIEEQLRELEPAQE